MICCLWLLSCATSIKVDRFCYVCEYKGFSRTGGLAELRRYDDKIHILCDIPSLPWLRIQDYYYDTAQAKAFYDVCLKNGDTAYHGGKIQICKAYMIQASSPTVIIDNIEMIDVSCNVEWDKNHPAGASLNDVFHASFTTLYPYVESGYKGDPQGERIDCLIAELHSEDMKMIEERDIWTMDIYAPERDLPADMEVTVSFLLDTGECVIFTASAAE